MPQSLKGRFNGQSKEVIEYTREWGVWKAMDKYQVKSYIAFLKFLEQETGDKNFGARPALHTSPGNNWAEDLLDAFTTKVLRMESEKERLVQQLEKAQRELEYYKAQKAHQVEPRISRLLEACR